MKKTLGLLSAVVMSVCLFSASVSAGSINTDINIYAKLKLYFNGMEDTSGNDVQFYNGDTYYTEVISAYLPKAMIYEDTTYVPLRYFANMLGVTEVNWDPYNLQISIGSSNAQNDNTASQDNNVSQTNASSVSKKAIKMSRYVNIHTGSNIQPMIDEDHMIISSIEDIYYYPQLTLIFNGVKDTSGADGMIQSGSNEVPKSLIYKQTTYVPLRFFSIHMGIPNDEIVFDKTKLTMKIGNKIDNTQNN